MSAGQVLNAPTY